MIGNKIDNIAINPVTTATINGSTKSIQNKTNTVDISIPPYSFYISIIERNFCAKTKRPRFRDPNGLIFSFSYRKSFSTRNSQLTVGK